MPKSLEKSDKTIFWSDNQCQIPVNRKKKKRKKLGKERYTSPYKKKKMERRKTSVHGKGNGKTEKSIKVIKKK